MSVSITGKLNRAANEFVAGESVGFGLRLGQQYFDRETKQKEWTNYSCVVFAKQGPQADFYRQTLVEGSIVAVSGKEQRIDSYEGNNGVQLSIEILNASIDNVFTMDSPAPQQNAAPQPAPQPKSFTPETPAGAPKHDPWADYAPSATTNGATIEQVKRKYNGDLKAAIANGHVMMAQQAPKSDGFDSDIPF